MSKFVWVCFLFTLLVPLGARAQVVQFTNGDRLTGKWVSVKGNTINFNADTVGTVSIPEAKVESITVTGPLVALQVDGKATDGKGASFASGVWTVETARGERKIKAADVMEIVPASDYEERLAKESAAPWKNWKGNATFGYSLQRGNQQAHTMSVGLNAVRHQMNPAGMYDRWRTTYTFNMLFATASTGGVQVQSNSLSTTLRQDYFFQPNNFLFVLGQADHIQAQNLYLRQAYGGGYGRDLLSGNRFKLSVLGGATFSNDKFVGVPAEQYSEALVGEHLGIRLTHQIQIDHSFDFYPNLTNRGQYRFDTASKLGFKLNSWLSANLGFIDFYISQIPSGSVTTVTTIGPGGRVITTSLPSQNNNMSVTAGIGANF